MVQANMAGFTQQQLTQQGANPNMYKAPTFAPPTPQYNIPGTTDYTTNPSVLNKPAEGTAVPGVGVVSDPQKYSSAPFPAPAVGGMQQSTKPVLGDPTLANQQVQQPQQAGQPQQAQPMANVDSPAVTSTGQKYQSALQNLNQNGGQAPVNSGPARVAVSQATPPPSPQEYKPTPSFIQFADPIMQSFIGQALQQRQNIVDTGYTAQALKANFGKQVADINNQELNLHNIMAGSVDDIRNEINKGGGFATESQVQGLVATRNKDLIRQYNSLEIQKNNMQNQMQMQVQLADADRQYAQDRYSNTMQAYQLYDGIKKNATTQVDQLVNRVGYSGLANAYQGDPNALALAEQALALPQGSLSDPQAIAAMETYRDRSLAMGQQKLNIQIGNQNGTSDTINTYGQMLADGLLAPSQLKKLGPTAYANVLNKAAELNGGTFDAEKADSQFAFGKSQSVQQTQVGLGFAKTTLQTLKTLSNNLDRGNITYQNKVGQWLGYQGSDPATVDFVTKANIAIDDVGAALGGGVSTDAKLGIAKSIIDPSLGNDAFVGQVNQLISSVQARANEYAKQKGGKVNVGGTIYPVGQTIGNGKTTFSVNEDGTLTGSDGKLYAVDKSGNISATK